MRLMFVHYLFADRGSAQDIHHFTMAAKELGHEVALYGPPDPCSPFNYSLDVQSADAVIFIFEWTTALQFGDALDLTKLVSRVPRHKRVVIDCDGKYNEAISVVGDYNHADPSESKRWIAICDSLSDKIYQPTCAPLRPNVGTYFFHAYSQSWEVPLEFDSKQYGMFYVGHNWFRWKPFARVLNAIEPIRATVGRLGIVGHGWDSPPPWANPSIIEDAYQSDPDYLRQLEVEVRPPIQFTEVIRHMSLGAFHPVVYRPLFDHLRLVTCRTFETFAANTIPLFATGSDYNSDFYGADVNELVLDGKQAAQDKIIDVVRRPRHYAGIVERIRQHLREKHSYASRVRELVEIVES
jgi:glycosyltransferase involved in cell wall biosynthesis